MGKLKNTSPRKSRYDNDNNLPIKNNKMQPFHSQMFEEGDSEDENSKQKEGDSKEDKANGKLKPEDLAKPTPKNKEQSIIKYDKGRPVYPTIEKLDLSAINDILSPKTASKQGNC